jgi:orotate phosphoribosyltransferase
MILFVALASLFMVKCIDRAHFGKGNFATASGRREPHLVDQRKTRYNPKNVSVGEDQQLEKAVELLMQS